MNMEYISGVKVRRLNPISNGRNWLMEILRSDWEEFEGFGQSYVTTCDPGVIKAWHYHKLQTDSFICIHGEIKLVLYDARGHSLTKNMVNELHLGVHNPLLVKIPPMVYHGFTVTGNETAIIINLPSELYNYDNPDEYRVSHDAPSIPYKWEVETK